ncbi:MAG: peptidase S14 [Mesorhizobium sp.]|nr:MAG: peptidase S14 [Mesorhizobium sp.]
MGHQCLEQRLSDAELLHRPNISLNGKISADTLTFFLRRLQDVREANEHLVMELNTEGGDADIARRIAMEIRLFRRHTGRDVYCVGKTYVYSAGVTIFAAFPRERRFLTEDAVLLVHERRLDQAVQLCGPIKASIQIIREQLNLLEAAHQLEMEGFRELVQGSKLSVEELYERATSNCYLHAEEALGLGLVGEILK